MQKSAEILSVEFDESSQWAIVCNQHENEETKQCQNSYLPSTHQSAPRSSTVPPIWLFPVSEFYTGGLIPYVFFVQLRLLAFYLWD